MNVIDPLSGPSEIVSNEITNGDDYIAMKNTETSTNIKFDDDVNKERSEKVAQNEESDIDIKCLDNGRYQGSFYVPNMFNGLIIGKRGSTKQRLEDETNTSIYIPRDQDTGNFIEIRGKTRDAILAAYHLIKNMVATSRSRYACNHFISIPMINAEITKNFQRFKDEVLTTCGDCPGMSEDLFQNPGKLHLTAGVMMLADDVESDLAIKTLVASKEDILNPLLQGNSLKVQVRGIEIMNDDPKEAKIVYAKVDDSSNGLLQQLMDNMVDYFVKAGLMKKERAHVTLHMTLLNSYFFMKRLYGDATPKGKWHGFDASKILELYKDYDFGTVEINELHLSQNNSATETGYYIASHKIMF